MSEPSPLNKLLHFLLAGPDVPPCEHGCVHVISGQWTALGLANVAEFAVRDRNTTPDLTARLAETAKSALDDIDRAGCVHPATIESLRDALADYAK